MKVKKARDLVTLQDWINELGVNEVARLLKVESATVRHWRRGANLPSDEIKHKIKHYSNGRVSYDAMIDPHFNRK